MITLRNNTVFGLSTDDKPLNVDNGVTFCEIDTGKEYMYDAENEEWYLQPSSGGGGGTTSNIRYITCTMTRVGQGDPWSAELADQDTGDSISCEDIVEALESGVNIVIVYEEDSHVTAIPNFYHTGEDLLAVIEWSFFFIDEDTSLFYAQCDWTEGDEDIYCDVRGLIDNR